MSLNPGWAIVATSTTNKIEDVRQDCPIISAAGVEEVEGYSKIVTDSIGRLHRRASLWQNRDKIALAGIGIIAYSKSDRMDVNLPVLG